MIYTLPGVSTGDRRRGLPTPHDVGGRDREEEVRGEHVNLLFLFSLSLSPLFFFVDDVGARLCPSRRLAGSTVARALPA